METTSEVSSQRRAVTTEPTALIVNPASRVGAESFELARSWLESAGVPLVEARTAKDPGEVARLIRAAVQGGVRRIVVGGGDGTLSVAAQELAHKDVRMAVLPLGTCNDFARSIRVPVQVAIACRIAASGEVRHVDLGLADGRPFLNAASIGLSSVITANLSDDMKRRLGKSAFALVAAGQAWSHRPFKTRLETSDGRVLTFDAHQVVIGNGRFHGGGRMVAPDASLSDRVLDVYVISSAQPAEREDDEDTRGRLQDLWTLFRVATLLRKGRHVTLPSVTHLRTARLKLYSEPSLEVDVDGELMGRTPMEFGVAPRALQVLVASSDERPAE